MLARLQRRVMLAATLMALAWLLAWTMADRPLIAFGGALVVALGYTVVLAVECVLGAWMHGDDPTSRPSLRQRVVAWFGECVVACQVFGWRQPFRADVHPDLPGRAGARGIVFVHGYVCNRGLWNPWLARCTQQRRPFVAVNLEPVFSDLDVYIPQLEAAIATLEHETGLKPLLVCHSMGGLVARAWLASTPDAAARIHHVVTIGTPHRGTWLARLSRTVNALHMRQASGWLQRLAAREPAEHARQFTCFYGHADNIVFPPLAATLAHADNRHLPAIAHVAMAFHPDVVREVERRLTATEASASALAAGNATVRGVN